MQLEYKLMANFPVIVSIWTNLLCVYQLLWGYQQHFDTNVLTCSLHPHPHTLSLLTHVHKHAHPLRPSPSQTLMSNQYAERFACAYERSISL